jgi:hypothetical protein
MNGILDSGGGGVVVGLWIVEDGMSVEIGIGDWDWGLGLGTKD